MNIGLSFTVVIFIVSTTKLTYGFTLLHNLDRTMNFFAQLSSSWPNMIKQFLETLFYLLYNYGTLWMSGLNALQSVAHALMLYIYISRRPSESKINWWRYYSAGATTFVGKQWHGNEKRPAAPSAHTRGGETNSARVNWSVTSAGGDARLTFNSDATRPQIGWNSTPADKKTAPTYKYICMQARAVNPIHASLCLFVCASGEFIQPPHSFINKLLLAAY
jgi:hypothetical protein